MARRRTVLKPPRPGLAARIRAACCTETGLSNAEYEQHIAGIVRMIRMATRR